MAAERARPAHHRIADGARPEPGAPRTAAEVGGDCCAVQAEPCQGRGEPVEEDRDGKEGRAEAQRVDAHLDEPLRTTKKMNGRIRLPSGFRQS